jgi:hypothetical protein
VDQDPLATAGESSAFGAWRNPNRRSAGRPCRRNEGNPNFSEAKSKPGATNSKSGQRNPRKILGFPSPNRALSRSYADPRPFFLFMPLLASKPRAAAWALFVRFGLFSVRFVSGSSSLLEQ